MSASWTASALPAPASGLHAGTHSIYLYRRDYEYSLIWTAHCGRVRALCAIVSMHLEAPELGAVSPSIQLSFAAAARHRDKRSASKGQVLIHNSRVGGITEIRAETNSNLRDRKSRNATK